MENHWEDQIFDLQILELLRVKGFSKVNEKAIQLLKEIIAKKTFQIMSKAKKYAENNQRIEANVFDVLNVMETDDSFTENFTQRLTKTSKKFDNSSTLIQKVIKETTGEDDINHKQFEEEFVSTSNVEQVTLHSKYPMCFIRNKKDIEKPLYVSLPEAVVLSHTEQTDQTVIPNEEIKKQRIEEMRSFELENCKIKGEQELPKVAQEEEKQEKPKLVQDPQNLFAQEDDLVDIINVFEISNSQFF